MITGFRTYELAVDFYKECKKLKLKGIIRDQFERASLSIAMNLAEGWGRLTRNDRRRFFYLALGSLRETQAIVELLDEKEWFYPDFRTVFYENFHDVADSPEAKKI